MAWFKVDDGFWSHPKTADLSDAATALWLRAGTWSAQHLTDGRVPYSALRFFRARRRSAAELVDAGLWSDAGDAFVFHSWADYQPSKSQVEAKREATRNRVNTWRDKQRNAVTGALHSDNSNAAPVPARPDPTHISTSAPAVLVTEHDFDEAWKHWPKKTERKKSLEKFKVIARRRGVDVLTADIRRFGEAYARTTERQFVPALNVWLNGERWTDDLPTAERKQGPRSAVPAGVSKNDEWMYR